MYFGPSQSVNDLRYDYSHTADVSVRDLPMEYLTTPGGSVSSLAKQLTAIVWS